MNESQMIRKQDGRPADASAARHGYTPDESRQVVEDVLRAADALDRMEDGIAISQDGIVIKAVELAGDVLTEVSDEADPEGPAYALRMAPLGAEALATGLLELARKARGLKPSDGYTTRPEILADVASKIRAGHVVDRLQISEYAVDPEAMRAVSSLITALDQIPSFRVRSEYGSAVVTRTMTFDEEQATLADAQREWDRAKALYEEFAESGFAPASYGQKEQIAKFCEAEGLPLPWVSP